eukprot:5764106-Amphidinium_carterae.1
MERGCGHVQQVTGVSLTWFSPRWQCPRCDAGSKRALGLWNFSYVAFERAQGGERKSTALRSLAATMQKLRCGSHWGKDLRFSDVQKTALMNERAYLKWDAGHVGECAEGQKFLLMHHKVLHKQGFKRPLKLIALLMACI